jgi:hypothetical protein
MAIWYILWPFGIFYGHLVILVFYWYIFSRFGILFHEVSGNPGFKKASLLLNGILKRDDFIFYFVMH